MRIRHTGSTTTGTSGTTGRMGTPKASNRQTRRVQGTLGTDEMRKEIIDWLRDAYAMERGLERSLEKQANSQDLHPSLRERAAQHLEETRRHAEGVRSLLRELGTDTSAIKTGMGVLAQATKGMGSKFARDERIKDLLDGYAMEHFEIACYLALAIAGERAGMPEVVQLCRSIIPDEERMAHTLKQALPEEIANYLFGAEAED